MVFTSQLKKPFVGKGWQGGRSNKTDKSRFNLWYFLKLFPTDHFSNNFSPMIIVENGSTSIPDDFKKACESFFFWDISGSAGADSAEALDCNAESSFNLAHTLYSCILTKFLWRYQRLCLGRITHSYFRVVSKSVNRISLV